MYPYDKAYMKQEDIYFCECACSLLNTLAY